MTNRIKKFAVATVPGPVQQPRRAEVQRHTLPLFRAIPTAA
jgi:hypothetical protein